MLPYARTANRLRTPEKEFRGRGLGYFTEIRDRAKSMNQNKRKQRGPPPRWKGKQIQWERQQKTQNAQQFDICFNNFVERKRSKKVRMKGCRVD